ncbi:hypothetical protein HYR99_26195 [Candidatus Poribacteria bacterium]|nr:hypothetical protein [Candidatus Poribacteria bacterium]
MQKQVFSLGLVLGSVLLVATILAGQGFAQNVIPLDRVEKRMMPRLPLTNEEMRQRDEIEREAKRRANEPTPFKIAEGITVDITPQTAGTWEMLADGTNVWRLRIASPMALSLNLGFTRYVMPKGGQLFLYSPDFQTVIGPFTEADNEEHG